jgi:trimethylamine:corrinoid methyltransferase-like protein
MDDILEAGTGGHFLMTDRTYKMFRTAYHMSSIFPRWGLEKWQEEGQPKSEDYLRRRTVELIETHQPPEDGEELLGRGEEYIRKSLVL